MEIAQPADPWTPPEGVRAIRVETTAYYAVLVPAATAVQPPATLIALHGWGQRSQSFIRRFAPLKEAGMLVVAPQAPHQTYLDMETRKVGFSWLTNYDRQRAVPDLVNLLDAILDDVVEQHGTLGPLVVLGFSQGVSVAYRYALRSRYKALGVVACGGDLPPDVHEAMGHRDPFPVLLIHGKQDGIVPIEKAEESFGRLTALKWPVEHHFFDGGHEIPPASVAEIECWFSGVLRDSR